jgi:maltose-binding protein MalE
VALGLAACTGRATTTTTEVSTTTTLVAATSVPGTTTTAGAAIKLLVWADEARTSVIQEAASGFAEATGVVVTVETKELGDIRDQMIELGPAGEGADIFVGAHGWTGQLAGSGVAAPIDLGGRASGFVQVALDAFTYSGNLYAVPYATDAIALYFNTDLVPEPPTTWEEIVDICAGLAEIENCVGLPGGGVAGDGGDAYHNYPFVSALGGYIFAYDPATGYDPTDVGLDSDGAIAGITFLQEQVDASIIHSTNYDMAKEFFLEGNQPFWITGPWEIATLNGQSTVNWSVATIPAIAGNAPAAFVTAEGLFLSAFSENGVVAQSFLVDYIAARETQQALHEADPHNPVLSAIVDGLADDPVAATFASSAAAGDPIPNTVEMGAVWAPLGENIQMVRNGELDATQAMTIAAQAVRDAVAG